MSVLRVCVYTCVYIRFGSNTLQKYLITNTNTLKKNQIQIQILPVHMSQISYFCDADATWC